jgi:hypothetical protein
MLMSAGQQQWEREGSGIFENFAIVRVRGGFGACAVTSDVLRTRN